jgi:hypothetical protein
VTTLGVPPDAGTPAGGQRWVNQREEAAVLEQAETHFTVERSVWPSVDTWAKEYGYKLVEWHAESRAYEKSHSIVRGFGRWQVQVEQHEHDVGIAARVRFRPLSPPGPTRDSTLDKARSEANALLAALDQPLLD